MDIKTKITEVLEELKYFFDRHNVKGWTRRTEIAIQQVNEGKLNLRSILDDFVGTGMGSLIDLYICSENGHLLKQKELDTNKQLAKLTEQLLMMKNGLDK